MKQLLVIISLIFAIALPSIGAPELKKNPYNEGIKLFNSGDFKGATSAMASAVSEKPDDAVRQLTYAVMLLTGRRYKDALPVCQKVIKLVPKDPTAYFLLGGAYSSLGMAKESRDSQKQAFSCLPSPAKVDIQGNQVTIMLNVNQPTSKLLVEEASAKEPNNAILQLLFGDILQIQGRGADAALHYSKSADLAPKWMKPWFNLGVVSLMVSPQEAMKNFRKAFSLDPANKTVHLWMGDAYAAMGDQESALKEYELATGAKTVASLALVRKGNIYLKKNELKKAEKEFLRSAELDPNYPVAATGLAEVYQRENRLDDSEKQYRHASELAHQAPSLQAVVAPNLASVQMEKGEYKSAIEELKKVVATNLPVPEVAQTLARAYQSAGTLQEGIDEYAAVLNKDPHALGASYFLLAAYTLKGDATGRANIAEKLIKEFPKNAPVWNRELGNARAVLGDKKGAIEAWRNGLELNPDMDVAGILPAATQAGLIDDLVSSYASEPTGDRTEASSLVLAGIYEHSGEFDKAVVIRQNLADSYPEKQLYWILLGDDLAHNSKIAEARSSYSKAAEMNNDMFLTMIARQRISELK